MTKEHVLFIILEISRQKFKKKILLLFLFIIIVFENFNVIKLIYKHNINNKYIISRKKKKYLLFLSRRLEKKLTKIEAIFLNGPSRFGNLMVLLNKAIFYCEILKCKRIIILNKNIYWFITKNTIDTENNMLIELGDIKDFKKNKDILIDNTNNYFWYYGYYQPQYRINIIKDQILQNLPKIITNPNDLKIYIRSGDIFGNTFPSLQGYYQPPLCFYKNIINNFKFENIYIISENKNNPVIEQIIIQYPKIIYKINSLKYDMSILISAYNIVGAFSTFLKVLILLNDNLRQFWYFNIQTNLLMSYFFSYEFNHKNISLFKMKESDLFLPLFFCLNNFLILQ